jgi:hypothetical protein
LSDTTLPTPDQINVYNSLDEQQACAHFLGKTLDGQIYAGLHERYVALQRRLDGYSISSG